MGIVNVSVIGCGTMGRGIAHVFALYGFEVKLIDLNNTLLNKALADISDNLDRQIKKGNITEDLKDSALRNITLIEGYDNTPLDTELVIEAVSEKKELKRTIFDYLDKQLKEETIFASNTSAISITELSAGCRPDRFIGMHFMNPVPVMKLVEIIRGYSTSKETFDAIKEITLHMEKTPVEVYDSPGFISNRLIMPMINEAVFSLMEGVATVEGIDTVMKLGMNHPMGPLALADLIGLDVCLNIMEVLYEGFNDTKYRPCPLLKKMVAANKLGRKTKEGFYRY